METAEVEIRPGKIPDPKTPFANGSSLCYHKKEIEFVPARKPFNGLTYSNGDFKIETLNPVGPDSKGRPGSINPAQANGNGRKAEAPEAPEGWLDQELSFRASFQRIGAGLENLGNTCFLNSVLQCLTYTEPLAAYLQTGKHQSSCRINGFCALCAIQKHVSRALKATGRILAPKDLVSNLRCISRNFRNARQEDAHEYMVNLLESMHRCCLPSGVPTESPGAYEKSLVHKIFGGRLRSQVKCLQCNHCSNKFDPFLDLSLEIAKADTLMKALGHFTAAEHLDGGAKQYQCQKCREKVRALKQLTIHKAPYVLTIHLKRFHSHDPGQKINKSVRFDTTLDFKPFVSGPYDGDLKYSLYGVLVHHGWSTHSGHYYCYVRTSTNMWYSLDDNQVRQVNESTVLQQKAYMLFYVRNRDTTPRKRAENLQRENLKENHGSNRVPFNFSQSSSSSVQFTQISDKCGLAMSSCSVITKDIMTVCSSNKVMNGSSINGSTGFVSVPKAPLSGESEKSTAPMITNYDVAAHSTTASGQLNDRTSSGNLKGSTPADVKSPIAKCLKDAAGEKLVGLKRSDKNPVNKTSEEIDSMKSVNESSCQSSQVNAPIEAENAADGDTEVAHRESVVLTASPIIHNESLQVETIVSNTHKKLKKKHVKHQFAKIHFGSRVLLGASLGPRKKRLKAKRCSSSTKKDRPTSDLGPSTSEISKPVLLVLEQSQTKKVKSHRRKVDHEGQKEAMSSSGEVGMRTAENCAVLASGWQSEKNISSTLKVSDGKLRVLENANDSKRDTMQNGLMSMLTRGLEETLVAHWDGVDLPHSPTMESNAAETAIGYVLDEWDEEYDRGKRKKIRQSRHNFDGPNFFQEIASENFKLKKAKIDRARLGNQPLRI